jgi:hypothetical protein
MGTADYKQAEVNHDTWIYSDEQLGGSALLKLWPRLTSHIITKLLFPEPDRRLQCIRRRTKTIGAVRSPRINKRSKLRLHYLLGECYLNLGNPTAAVGEYKILKSLDAQYA